MDQIKNLEIKLAALYAKAPNLPKSAQRWIATNAWWIILVFAILSTLALPSILHDASQTAFPTHITSRIYGNLNDIDKFNAIANAVIAVITVALLYLAVKPLRAMRKLGWRLLFANQLLAVLASVIGFFVSLHNPLFIGVSFMGLVYAVLFVAIETYFLFQVRSEFSPHARNSARPQLVNAKIVKKPVAKKTTDKKSLSKKK